MTKVQTAANATYGIPETIQNYRYDKIGQVTKHVQTIGNQSYQLEYGYNLAGQLVSEKYPSGKIVNMTVDNFGRLQTVADAQRTYLSSVGFNNQGLLSQVNLGNATSETFSYNDRFQMTSQSLNRGSEVLQKYDYSYGTVDLATGTVNTQTNNGQLSKIEGFIGANKQWSQRFGYDELGRLKEAREYKQGTNTQLTYKQVFDFDRFGNLYRKNASNPTAGQQNPLIYTPIENADIDKTKNRLTTGTTYDDAGQVVNDTKFRSMSFAYDANGRQVNSTNSINSTNAQTVYDALGNRVATKINDIWQYMVYDAFGKLVAEYGTASEGLGGVKYVQQDWQGSVRTVTNNNGFVVARTDHQAFGGEVGYGTGQRSVEQGYNVGKVTRQGYGLTERDDATGQDHTWFRKNENLAGRWTSPDPYNGSMSLGDPQSFNRYSYVQSQPTNFVDPSGLLIIAYNCFCVDASVPGWTDPNPQCQTCHLYIPDGAGFGGPREPPINVGGGVDNGGGTSEEETDCGAGSTPQSAAGSGNYVNIGYTNGDVEHREGGSRSWRNNNPGNLRSSQNQIGRVGRFAVFGSEADGESAKTQLLMQPRYQNQTIAGVIATWAPPSENNTARYQAFVANQTGLNLQTPMSALSSNQLASMANAMRTYEGWKPGTVECRQFR